MKAKKTIENKLKQLAGVDPKDVTNPKQLDGFIVGLRWVLKESTGITITGIKVVGICSKCRKEGDEIPKNKDGSIVPDNEISCVNTAFGNCTKDEVEDGK